MTIWTATLLGILQGLTEFLPVSSSGHLVLGQSLLGLNPETLKSFDIAIHGGTLLAIFIYFRKDLWVLLVAFFQTIFFIKPTNPDDLKTLPERQKFILTLVLATIPAVVVGFLWGDYLDEKFLNPVSVAILLIVVGVIFILAEWLHQKLAEQKITVGRGFLIGIAQALALIPGVSRSGATIAAGLVLGVNREKAARFSFLLGAIAILAATVLAVYKSLKGEYSLPNWEVLVTGILTSMLAGLAAIYFLMNYLKKHSLAIFAYYRWIIAGAFLIYFFR